MGNWVLRSPDWHESKCTLPLPAVIPVRAQAGFLSPRARRFMQVLRWQLASGSAHILGRDQASLQH